MTVPESEKGRLLTQEWVLRDFVLNLEEVFELSLIQTQLEDENSVTIVQAFVNCVYSGITPPAYLTIHIAERFLRVLESNGKRTFDDVFGVNVGTGQTSALAEWRTQKTLQMAFYRIWALNYFFPKGGHKKVSKSRAAELAVQELGLSYSPKTLINKYHQYKYEEKMVKKMAGLPYASNDIFRPLFRDGS